MSNAARPRKSSMEGAQISDRHRAWQEAQDATSPELELILHFPPPPIPVHERINWDRPEAPNYTELFFPDPTKVQTVEHLGTPTIWDYAVEQRPSPEPEVIPPPEFVDGVPNIPEQFHPDPERTDKAPDWRTPSIWDATVGVNIKDSSGLKVYGGRVKLMGIDFNKYSGFVLTFPGGDEARYSITEGKVFGKVNTVLRQFQEALRPYVDDPEFLYNIEGPLLVILYWYRSRGLSVNEVRLLERG